MKKRECLVWTVASLVLAFSSIIAHAGDTSPYLVGVWEDDGQTIYTDFIIVNPTGEALDVYAAFFDNSGGFIQDKCFTKVLSPNAKWYLRGADLGLSKSGLAGTAKFVATKQGQGAYNKNLVIGGFQNRWLFQMSSSQANLSAVVLTRDTIAEINDLLGLECTPWPSE